MAPGSAGGLRLPGQVLREHSPASIEDWLDKPIPELGGLRLTFEDGEVAVVLPDQIVASSDHEILSATKDRLVAAEARVAEHERRAAEAERRAAELEQRLREAGIDPDV